MPKVRVAAAASSRSTVTVMAAQPQHHCPKGCGYVGVCSSDVHDHLRSRLHSAVRHKCAHCPNTYQHLRLRNTHQKTCLTGGPPKTHLCPEPGCGYAGARAAHLRSHMSTRH